jgi:hypothetical protein
VEEQRSDIRFLWSGVVKHSQIYRKMKVQYGDSCLSQLAPWKSNEALFVFFGGQGL